MKRYFVWTLVIVNSLIGLTRLITSVIVPVDNGVSFTEAGSFFVIILTFSVLGAMIILRADGNLVGWLMLLLGFVLADPFAMYLVLNEAAFQTHQSVLYYFAFWTQGWFYFLTIYAVFLIILYFPDGRPPSPRWKIITFISIVTLGQYVLAYTIQPKYGDAFTFIDNPIALLPVSADETLSGVVFGLGLILLAVSSVASVFVRFKRAGLVERSQIKWLLFSGTISLVAIGYRLATYQPDVSDWTSYLLTVALLSVAFSIAIAILRYRLYNIDIIIRRTVQYSVISAVLAAVYFGSITVMQRGISAVAQTQSPIAIVLSTLLIAALFNPLRRRVQTVVDRRFYRQQYNAEQVLAQFAQAARDETDMDALQVELLRVVQETMQPEHVSIWVKNDIS